MASNFSGRDRERLPDLDEFRVSGFHPDLSDNEEKVGGQEDTDTLGLDRLESYRFEPFSRVPTTRIRSQRKTHSDIGSSSGGDSDP